MTAGKPTRAGFDIDLTMFQPDEASLAFVLLSRGVNTIEHKHDCQCVKTGNVFIEYHQPSGPSGIATSDATMWALEYDDNCWVLVPTDLLKDAARRAYRDKWRRKKGGDYNRFDGVLVPIKWLVPQYTVWQPKRAEASKEAQP